MAEIKRDEYSINFLRLKFNRISFELEIYMKKIVLIIGLFNLQNSFAATKIAMFVNEGFKGEEYFIPRKAFDDAGYEVKVVTRYSGMVNPTRHDQPKFHGVSSDLTFETVKPEGFDALVFVGGSGAWTDFFPNLSIHKILKGAFERNQWLALICASTGVLATADNLGGDGTPLAKGRHVTGYPEVSGLLKKLGQVSYDLGDPNLPKVVVDGHLITGRDPMSAHLFGETIVSNLGKR